MPNQKKDDWTHETIHVLKQLEKSQPVRCAVLLCILLLRQFEGFQASAHFKFVCLKYPFTITLAQVSNQAISVGNYHGYKDSLAHLVYLSAVWHMKGWLPQAQHGATARSMLTARKGPHGSYHRLNSLRWQPKLRRGLLPDLPFLILLFWQPPSGRQNAPATSSS